MMAVNSAAGGRPPNVHNDRVKVLYVVGWGRSGSTILDNVLGQLDGFFSVGELFYVWDRNMLNNRFCGCGQPFGECEVWAGIMREAFGGTDGVNVREMIRLRDGGARTRHVPLMLAPGGEAKLKSRLDGYLDKLGMLYQGIQRSTGSRVIVDSSKLPSYGRVLEMVPAVDLYVVHLVRDPRAVTHSWQRKRVEPDTGTLMRQYNVFESPLIWDAWNGITELFWRRRQKRYLRMRYEDFVADPRKAIGLILDLVGESASSFPIAGSKVELGVTHTVGGNPSRFKTGPVKLHLDEEWKAEMKQSRKAIVTALSWPMLRRYGY
jgi:hypothetical protein